MHFKLNEPNIGDGLKMLRAMRTGIGALVIMDPQYRGILDKLSYGNEGERQQERSQLPQMTDILIHRIISEVERVLRPSRYCLLWCDKRDLCQGTFKTPSLPIVDLIVWEKPRIGMGYRTRRKSEYLLVMQKPPILARATWSDHALADVWSEDVGTGHPHAKPEGLMQRLIAATTKPGETVIDPSAGGYSVMRAAHAAGRQFLGTDLLSCELPVEEI